MKRLVYVFFSLFLLSSCVSTYTALQKIQPGLTKQEVRVQLGAPDFVGRAKGWEQWTYKFKRESKQYTMDIYFEDSYVIKKGPLLSYPNYKAKMEAADSLDDYEANAYLYQKQKQEGFRKINSTKKPTVLEPAELKPVKCGNKTSEKSVH